MPDIALLPENASGRDFLLGDLHGELSLLNRLLEYVRFDPACDRLISVGDLIDRGPSSLEALALLEQPWFHPVKGNHEAYFAYSVFALMEHVRFRPSAAMGDAWLAQAWERQPNKMIAYARLVDVLPTVLIHQGVQRFHVVHGALSYRSGLLDDAGLDRLQLPTTTTEAEWREMHWHSRALEGMGTTLRQWQGLFVPEAPADRWHAGLSLTFCGHTVCPDLPVLAQSHLHIDSGGHATREESAFALNLLEYAPAPAGAAHAPWRLRLYQASALWGLRERLIEIEPTG